MKNFLLLLSFVFAATLAAKNEVGSLSQYESIAPIEIYRNQFFYKGTKTRYFIKGIAYQQDWKPHPKFDANVDTAYIDPLADTSSCLRDLENLVELGVNLVRVYQINPLANHDVCMDAYAKQGIYVLADLAEPSLSINRENPSWNVDLLERYASVIDSLNKYNNVLGFIAGNEVSNSKTNTEASAFVKAAIRDSKRYIAKMGYRKVPVGYATNDDEDIRLGLTDYMVCEAETSDDRADFIGINMYEWCGYSTFATSGYRDRTIEYSNYPVPLFFSEYGCNSVQPRPFTEVDALYGSKMTGVWSGGIAYSYFEGENNYGIVEERANGTIVKYEDFYTLKSKLRSVEPLAANRNSNLSPDISQMLLSSSSSVKTISCPKVNGIWKSSSSLPMTPDSGKCECIQSTFSCILSPQKSGEFVELLNQVCDEVDCSELQTNAELGWYGSLSDCSTRQQLSYALNQYYQEHGSSQSSCDFEGHAILVSQNSMEDLAEIFIQDGRTCKEAIAKVLSNSQMPRNLTAVGRNDGTNLPETGFLSPAHSNISQHYNGGNSLPSSNNMKSFASKNTNNIKWLFTLATIPFIY